MSRVRTTPSRRWWRPRTHWTGASSLDATASPPQGFVWTPTTRQVPEVGSGQILIAELTPTDPLHSTTATGSAGINIVAVAPSTIPGVVIDDGSASRLLASSLPITLGDPVVRAPSVLELREHSDGLVADLGLAASAVGDKAGVVPISGGLEFIGASSRAGSSRLIFHGAAIPDGRGRARNGEADGAAGRHHVDEAISRLFRTSDGDGDNRDSFRLRGALDKRVEDAAYLWYRDNIGDGVLDRPTDFVGLARRRGKRLGR